jgi:hypothetical protein
MIADQEATTVHTFDPEVDTIPADWYEIPSEFLPELQKRFDALAKRAAKLGCAAPYFTVEEAFDRPEMIEDVLDPDRRLIATGRTIQIALVSVHGDAPKYNGWRPVAVIDRDLEEPHLPNVVSIFEGEDNGSASMWRTWSGECQHCKLQRTRKTLVVCEHDNGDQIIVGKSCLRDFLGHQSPEHIASWVEVLATLDDLVRSFSGRIGDVTEYRYDPVYFLTWVVAMVDAVGWVSRGTSRAEEGRIATVDRVLRDMDARTEEEKRQRAVRPLDLTDEHREWAERAIEWAQQLDAGDNDYLLNVNAVASKSGWRWKDLGIGASIASTYKRELEKFVAQVERARVFSNSEHVGTVGKRITFTGKALFENKIEGYYGTTTIVTFVTDDGDKIKWFASGDSPIPLHLHGTFTGTVKNHDEYKGTLETTVSRVKFVIDLDDSGLCPASAYRGTDEEGKVVNHDVYGRDIVGGAHAVTSAYGNPLEPKNAKQRKNNTVTCRLCGNDVPALGDPFAVGAVVRLRGHNADPRHGTIIAGAEATDDADDAQYVGVWWDDESEPVNERRGQLIVANNTPLEVK